LFRPEKEGFELMRAALPHLRVLTLAVDKLSLLTKYLTAEEKTFLAGQMVFMEENCAAAVPVSILNTTKPRKMNIIHFRFKPNYDRIF